MDTDNVITGDISMNMDKVGKVIDLNNKDQIQNGSGDAVMCSAASKGLEGVSDSIGRKGEECNVVENGVTDAKDISPSEQMDERVPKIYICTEHCKSDNAVDDDNDDTSVPYKCETNSVSDQSNFVAEEKNQSMESGTQPNANPSPENSQSDIVKVTPRECKNENVKEDAALIECPSKSAEAGVVSNENQDSNADGAQCSLSDKENEIEPDPTSITLENHDQLDAAADSKGSTSSSTSSPAHHPSSSSSKFSFFRSIQNILIATKWSKLRGHKSHKHQNNGEESEEDQDKQYLQKPEKRQRKISSKSQPGDLLADRSSDDKELDSGEHSDISRGREGLEYLDNARHSKDKTSGKHSFSLFKRHNDSTDSQKQQQQQQQYCIPHPPAELTERQKALLRSSWAEIGDSVGQVGVIAFIGLFETHPDVIDTFNQFRGMSLESVITSISLKEHALRVMTTVEKFLNRIDRPDKLQKILEDLGKRHVGYRFKVDYIQSVGMQFIGAMRPHVSSWTPETEQAWTALVDTMTFHMERGALAEMQTASNC